MLHGLLNTGQQEKELRGKLQKGASPSLYSTGETKTSAPYQAAALAGGGDEHGELGGRRHLLPQPQQGTQRASVRLVQHCQDQEGEQGPRPGHRLEVLYLIVDFLNTSQTKS